MKQKHYFIRFIGGLLAVLILFLCPALPAHADGNQDIYSIAIDITLDEKGNAYISETWDVYTDSGTEWYLVQGDLGKIKIKDFTVTDETGLIYENIGDWDVDRSFDYKAGKCGIVDKGYGEYELCWGLGNYGYHTYTASYTMTNFVKGFDDYCAFNQRLINDELSASPQSITVTIRKEGTSFSEDEVGVWAFGFDGEIYVMDGEVQAWSNDNLGRSDYVTIMCRFPRDMFNPKNIQDGTFDDMKERALKGSDYNFLVGGISVIFSLLGPLAFIIILFVFPIGLVSTKGGFDMKVTTFEESRRQEALPQNKKVYKNIKFWIIAVVMLLLIFPLGVIYLLINLLGEKEKTTPGLKGSAYPPAYIRKELRKSSYCYRDIPFNGSLNELYVVSQQLLITGANNNIIGAYFLKWLQEGCITVREVAKTGLAGSFGKTEPSIVLTNMPRTKNVSEGELFTLLDTASGGDHILQEKELYRWARTNHSKVDEVLKALLKDGEKQLAADGYAGKIFRKSLLLNSYNFAFTDPGRMEAHNLDGLLRFFKNYTLLNERGVQDVALWDQYLIIAQLFGMADEVAKTFSSIYPAYFTDPSSNYYHYNSIGTFTALSSISTAGMSGIRSGGGGGSSSGGGGGGSSGGGSGGGCR